MGPKWIPLVVSIFVAGASTAPCQESSSFLLRESVLSAGGAPVDTTEPGSLNFRITLATIGDTPIGFAASAGFRLDGGFVAALPPPGEVVGLRFDARSTIVWSPERSSGSYNVYGDGSCLLIAIAEERATLPPGDPPAGSVIEYLVTVTNRLGEEGTLGFGGTGVERPNQTPCPRGMSP